MMFSAFGVAFGYMVCVFFVVVGGGSVGACFGIVCWASARRALWLNTAVGVPSRRHCRF